MKNIITMSESKFQLKMYKKFRKELNRCNKYGYQGSFSVFNITGLMSDRYKIKYEKALINSGYKKDLFIPANGDYSSSQYYIKTM